MIPKVRFFGAAELGGVILLRQIGLFWKKEAVLCIAALCAVATMFAVPPDADYMSYIDVHVLCLLLCLMAVVAGFQVCGVFSCMTFHMLCHCRSGRILSVILVLLPFFSSMLVTNDVALLVFVPFTLGLLVQMDCRSAVAPMLVMQTIAANLGSMATPVGNPQNLFLYSAYNLTAEAFFAVTLPLSVVSLLCLVIASVPILPKSLPGLELEESAIQQPGKLAVYGLLFVVCLLAVFRVLPDGVMMAAVLAAIVIMDRELLRDLDYALLITFVCFFIVSGNLGRIGAVHMFLQTLLGGSTLLTAVGASQLISNVPAAVLLSGFTDQWHYLLEGVNIGGLGTPIASLASLITLKLYLRWPQANAGKFLLIFLLANLVGLAVLLAAAKIF